MSPQNSWISWHGFSVALAAGSAGGCSNQRGRRRAPKTRRPKARLRRRSRQWRQEAAGVRNDFREFGWKEDGPADGLGLREVLTRQVSIRPPFCPRKSRIEPPNQRAEQVNLWRWSATRRWPKTAGPRERPCLAASSGSPFKAPGSAEGYLLKTSFVLYKDLHNTR